MRTIPWPRGSRNAVHQVLQAAFDWSDCHLHRFSIGGDTFDTAAEWFLCEYDVEEGEHEGTPDADVTLDETLVEPGDVLHYVYDYGDNWDLTIRLEEVLPLTNDAPRARCVDGQRAAPPGDCGGLRDAEDLAQVVDDPAESQGCTDVVLEVRLSTHPFADLSA